MRKGVNRIEIFALIEERIGFNVNQDILRIKELLKKATPAPWPTYVNGKNIKNDVDMELACLLRNNAEILILRSEL